MLMGGKRKCGFLYDEEMERHENYWDPLHLERPERARCIRKRLEELSNLPLDYCTRLQSRAATIDEIMLVHHSDLIDTVASTCASDPGENLENHKAFSEKFNTVYVNQFSHQCALLAAGSTIDLADAVFRGDLDNGLAVVRPPGHHASHHESNGFCIYNNIAIAAQHLLKNRGAKRILIVDWDVHHGQGTQRTFYDDDRVLFFSIHKYKDGLEWPNLREGNFDHIGTGRGTAFNINVPLNQTNLGDADYLTILHQVLMPVAFEYDPEIIIVSAGYDAAIGCPDGHMRVSPAMYGHFTHALGCLAGGRIAVILEGGYCLESLAEGVACTLEALVGYPPFPLPSVGKIESSAVSSVLGAISSLRTSWKSLAFQERQKPETAPATSGRLPVHQPRIRFTLPDDLPPNEYYVYMDTEFYTPAETVNLRYEINGLKQTYDAHRRMFPRMKRTCYALEFPGMQSVEAYGPIMLDGLKDYNTLVQHTKASTSTLSGSSGCTPLTMLLGAIVTGEYLNGFAIVRHLGSGTRGDSGIRAAIETTLKKRDLQRVLLVVWDINHCDRAETKPFKDPRVLRVSIGRRKNHLNPECGRIRSEPGNFQSDSSDCINISWQDKKIGDGDCVTAFLQVIMPVAYEYAPELVIISCRFGNTLESGDKNCGIKGTSLGIATQMLMSLAGGRVAFCLEETQSSPMFDDYAESVVRSLLGFPVASSPGSIIPSANGIQCIKRAIDEHIASDNLHQALQYRVTLLDPIDETTVHSGSNTTTGSQISELSSIPAPT